jgi:hypothetical protein
MMNIKKKNIISKSIKKNNTANVAAAGMLYQDNESQIEDDKKHGKTPSDKDDEESSSQ